MAGNVEGAEVDARDRDRVATADQVLRFVGRRRKSTQVVGVSEAVLKLEGRLGVKSGAGFYEWTPERAAEVGRARDEELVRRLKLMGLGGEA